MISRSLQITYGLYTIVFRHYEQIMDAKYCLDEVITCRSKDNPHIFRTKKNFYIIITPASILETKEFKSYLEFLKELHLERYSVIFNDDIPDEIIKTKIFEPFSFMTHEAPYK